MTKPKKIDTLSSSEVSTVPGPSVGSLIVTSFKLVVTTTLAAGLFYGLAHPTTSPFVPVLAKFQKSEHPVITFACVGIVLFLILASRILAVVFQELGYGPKFSQTHKEPRGHQLTGVALRAYSAHLNAVEAFTLFGAPFLYAAAGNLTGVSADVVARLALVFVALRLAYHVTYILGLSTFRTIIWTASYLTILSLFVLPFAPNFWKVDPQAAVAIAQQAGVQVQGLLIQARGAVNHLLKTYDLGVQI
eukprot:TRINITY_DN12712_c0_g1_i1.p1 TRINITY_DN12712_c0_g1~~TRINITY_DN12712_c0_g1_i1.p1  ORF type:complete len:247 (+),score=30.11 TRINITY_DN12712_c0_g1_i1:64-804(+)